MTKGTSARSEWISQLIHELSDFLGEPVELIDESDTDEGGFSCFIRSSPPRRNGFELCWEGILGMAPDDEGEHVSASLFLYSRGVRVSAFEEFSSYLEIAYKGSEKKGGEWVDLGWIKDEWDEFAAYSHYGC
ncbi:hypothetical protein ABZ553_01480 [Streptomyces sparsogenes]|uniref:hypothetical protein n=1 Tax=Streptomyces sparsogenes TaxID=67365 RepID=UPI0033FCA3E2